MFNLEMLKFDICPLDVIVSKNTIHWILLSTFQITYPSCVLSFYSTVYICKTLWTFSDREKISEKAVTKVIKQITRKKLKSGKIKKIIKVIKVKPKPSRDGESQRVPGRRRVRCGECEGCMVESDCGKCIYCRYALPRFLYSSKTTI